MILGMKMNKLITHAVIATCAVTAQVCATENNLADATNKPVTGTGSPFAISAILGAEAYEDSPNSSLSRGMGISFVWDDLKYDSPYKLNRHYVQAKATYYYEKDAEHYDSDRYRNSGDFKFNYQHPLTSFDDGDPSNNDTYIISLLGRYEGHYNSQQLEEFEQLAIAGLALNRRFTGSNHYDLGLRIGLAYSEEEKDDDWPREHMGIENETLLNRAGFGYYVEWQNRYTYGHSGLQLIADYSRYDGRWQYDAGQFYTVNRLSFGVITPLADQNNLLHFMTQYINRDYEVELLGFEDTLYRVAAEYVHYF